MCLGVRFAHYCTTLSSALKYKAWICKSADTENRFSETSGVSRE